MDYKAFLQQLKIITEYDFSDYSENSIARRIQKISDETGLTLEQILKKITTDKCFLNRVVEDITVNTTELFRDPQVWVSLCKTLYKQMPKGTVTFWHMGCSVGLEVYSNLILLNEMNMLDKCRVIGTDLNPRVLDVARKGEYAYKFNLYFRENFDYVMSKLGLNVPFEKYFDIDADHDVMTIKPLLRTKPKFLSQNIVKDPPPFAYKVDVVFIRNVMIYFNNSLQIKTMNMITDKLYDGGAVIFGKREDLPMSMKSRYTSMGQYYQKTVPTYVR